MDDNLWRVARRAKGHRTKNLPKLTTPLKSMEAPNIEDFIESATMQTGLIAH
jgi:hypothetical protein